MSTPLPKQGSAPAPDNEVELQSQPMDLANKTSTIITAGSGTIVPSRVIGDGAKSIFLVRDFKLDSYPRFLFDKQNKYTARAT